MPVALVGDVERAVARAATVTTPVRRAPLRGVVEQVGDRALERRRLAGDLPGVEVDVEVQAGRPPAHPVQRALDDVGEVDRLELGRDRLVAGQLGQVADERGELLDLEPDVVHQLGAGLRRQPAAGVGLGEQVEVGAQGGERGAQLVAGVGDQLALPVRLAGQRRRASR